MMERKLDRLTKSAHEHLYPGYYLLRYHHTGFETIPKVYRITRVVGKDVYGEACPDIDPAGWWRLNLVQTANNAAPMT